MQKPKSQPQNKPCSGWEKNREMYFMSEITLCKETPSLRKWGKKKKKETKSMEIIV